MNLVSPEIEKYALEHTTPAPEHLQELARVTHQTMETPQMLSGPVEGMLLQFLVWATGARRVLEVGMFSGFSAQMMAAALPEGGELITCDINPKAEQLAKEYFKRSPHGEKTQGMMGPALETMKSLRPPFDLVFIDADKENYLAYYERALELLSPKGIIAVDNVLWSGRVLDPKEKSDHAIAAFNEHVRKDPRVYHVMLTVRDGVMLVRKK